MGVLFAGGIRQKCECVCVADSRIPLEVEQCLMSPRSEVRVLMEMWTKVTLPSDPERNGWVTEDSAERPVVMAALRYIFVMARVA